MSPIMFNSSRKKKQTSGILSQCRIVESLEGCTWLTRAWLIGCWKRAKDKYLKQFGNVMEWWDYFE